MIAFVDSQTTAIDYFHQSKFCDVGRRTGPAGPGPAGPGPRPGPARMGPYGPMVPYGPIWTRTAKLGLLIRGSCGNKQHITSAKHIYNLRYKLYKYVAI